MVHPQIPLNDLKRRARSVGVRVESALLDAVNSGTWLNGQYSARFSRAFAESVNSAECVLVGNGTDALEIALQSVVQVRRPAGREVITVANAGGYTTIACHKLGMIPVYADIETDSQLMSIESVINALSDQTAAVVATHLYGGVIDVKALRTAMDKAGFGIVSILEDCAQAHGAKFGASAVGSMGDLATFSFYPTKNLGAFGDAGAIVSSDTTLINAARDLRQYGWSDKYHVAIPGGRNSRMDELQAAILCELLPLLQGWNTSRKQIIQRYRQAASSKLSLVNGGEGSADHLAIAMVEDREKFRRYLSSKNIQTDVHYPVLDFDQKGWKELPMRISPSGIAVSAASVMRIVTLPCFPEMTEQEVSTVCAALSEYTSK